MIRNLLCVTLFICSSSKASVLEWGGMCLPESHLSPGTVMNLNTSDKNFDSSDGYGPSLYFDGDEIAKHVPKFQHQVIRPNGSAVFENLMINLTQRSLEVPKLGNKPLTKSKEVKSLYFYEGTSPYDWLAFKKKGGNYEFWGTCDSDAGNDYTCLRSVKINDIYANYYVSNYNIRQYEQIEDFIEDWLESNECSK